MPTHLPEREPAPAPPASAPPLSVLASAWLAGLILLAALSTGPGAVDRCAGPSEAPPLPFGVQNPGDERATADLLDMTGRD